MVSSNIGAIVEATRRMSRFFRRREDEKLFVAYYNADVASNGGTINIHVNNISATQTIDVHRFIVTTQFRGGFAIHDSFSTAPSGGTTLSIDNLRMDESGAVDDGVMEVNHSVSFTADGTHIEETIPSGGSGANTVGGNGSGTEPLIDPGREIVIELQNDSSATRPATLGIVYSERHV